MHQKEQRTVIQVKQLPMSYLISGKRASGHDNVDQPVFEARRELQCVRCNRAVAIGEHFTKQRSPHLKQKNRKEHPCCQQCYPFEEIVDTRPPICF